MSDWVYQSKEDRAVEDLEEKLAIAVAHLDAIKHQTECIGSDKVHVDFNCIHCVASTGPNRA